MKYFSQCGKLAKKNCIQVKGSLKYKYEKLYNTNLNKNLGLKMILLVRVSAVNEYITDAKQDYTEDYFSGCLPQSEYLSINMRQSSVFKYLSIMQFLK